MTTAIRMVTLALILSLTMIIPALVDAGDVLASATLCDLAAVLDQRRVRVCGIGGVFTSPARAGDHARELVERLLEPALSGGE